MSRMRKFVFVLAATLISLVSKTYSQEINFSDSSVISVITCSPGEEIYAKFGHTGVRINDPVSKINVVFNYGIFSFNTDNFIYKFIKGETDYSLGVYETSLFLPEYEQRNSTVWEQVLNLTIPEKRKIINALVTNYRPENRIYRYNFVYDNCATRPRDKILYNIDGHVIIPKLPEPKTFRQWVGVYVGNDSWTKFGIDILLGKEADKVATEYECMFLPEVMMSQLQLATIITNNKHQRNLVSDRNVLVNSTPVPEQKLKIRDMPMTFFIIVLILAIAVMIYEYVRRTYFKAIDFVLLFVTGLIGWLLMFLMVVSTHPLVNYNLNILWLNPFNLIAAFFLWSRKYKPYLFVYQLLNMLALVLAMLVLALSIQSINAAVFPILVLLLLRYSRWVVRTKHKLYRHSKSFLKYFGFKKRK